MGHIPVAKPSPILREWTFPKRGLLIALVLLGAFAVGGVALASAWPEHASKMPNTWVDVGRAADLKVDTPQPVPGDHLWLVKLQTGEILALYRADPRLGCTVPWRPDFEFRGITGWFRNPCHSETYDLTGTCFSGPCIRGLDRFPVQIANGQVRVLVDKARLIQGPPVDFGDPIYRPVWAKGSQ